MRKSKVLVPNYYDKFECIGGKCEDHCCKAWTITIDKDTYTKYNKLKNSEFKKKLNESISRNRKSDSNSSYGKIRLENGVCPMFNEEGLCEVYLNLGPEYMSDTCKQYPRQYNKVDEVIEKSLTLSCIEAARIILLNKNPMEFNLSIEEVEDIKKENIFRSIDTKKYKSISEKYFYELRDFSIDLIQNRRFSIEERLIILGLFFEYIDKNMENKDIVTSAISKYTMNINKGNYDNLLEYIDLGDKTEAQLEFLRKTFRELISNKNINNERYLTNLNHIIKSLKLDKSNESDIEDIKENFTNVLDKYYTPFILDNEHIYENYLVNYMFYNNFPLSKISLMNIYLNMMVQFAIIKMNVIGMAAFYKEKFEENNVVDIIQGFNMVLGHDIYLLEKIHKYLIENKLDTVAHMILLLGK